MKLDVGQGVTKATATIFFEQWSFLYPPYALLWQVIQSFIAHHHGENISFLVIFFSEFITHKISLSATCNHIKTETNETMKSQSTPTQIHSYSKQEVLELPNVTQFLFMNMQIYATRYSKT